MTKQEFLSLAANRKSLTALRAAAAKYYGGLKEENGELHMTESAPEFEFWNGMAAGLAEYLGQPAKIRKILEPWCPQKALAQIEQVKSYGYRKTLVIPF